MDADDEGTKLESETLVAVEGNAPAEAVFGSVDEEASCSEPQESIDARDRGPDQNQHRVVVHNLPKYFGYKQLKTWFTKIGLNPTKIKPTMGRGRRGTAASCFLNFRSSEEKDEAIRIIATNTFSGSVLSVKEADAVPDPYSRGAERRRERGRPGNKRENGEQIKDPEAEILDIVTNLHHLSYPDQLLAKRNHAYETLRKIDKQFLYKSQGTLPWLKQTKGHFCHMDAINPSPDVDKYRNKCEFSIGFSPAGEKTIGFKLGKYKEGTIFVVSPRACSHINDSMKGIVEAFEKFIQSSKFAPFNDRERTGNWHQLTARTNTERRSLVSIHLHPQKLESAVLIEEKERLQRFCLGLEGPAKPDHVYWVLDDKMSGVPRQYEKIVGTEIPAFEEKLLGYRFKISPDAFFQVNTRAAEVLYSSIVEAAEVTKDSIVLDLCCGTGTIGLVMAKHVKQVYGIELVETAVTDARHNAEVNGVENIEFIAARVEDALEGVLSTNLRLGDDVVVILDPPRSGVHATVIESLRKAGLVRRLVYVACAADNDYTINNLYGLCKNKSRNVDAGEIPFIPVRCLPVDLFPLTKNVEMVFVFDRATASANVAV